MADSIHTQIVDAIVARLNADISVANGYNFDLAPAVGGGGAQGVLADFQPGNVTPWIVVDVWRVDKEDAYATVTVATGQLHMQLNVDLPADPDVNIQSHLQALIDDVEKCLGIARQETPPLGVDGLDDIRMQGHVKVPWDDEDENLNALMEAQVLYQHAITDPTSPS